MAEKDTQKKTSQEASAEKKNTENSEEQLIPKASMDAVSEKYKAEKKQREELENKLKEFEQTKLKEKEDFKKLAETLEAENKQLKLNGLKRDLIQEAINNKELNPKLAKMVNGSTEEEIHSSLEDAKAYHKEILDQYKNEHTAKDDSGAGARNTDNVMSGEEYEKLLKEDPEKADQYLREWTEKSING